MERTIEIKENGFGIEAIIFSKYGIDRFIKINGFGTGWQTIPSSVIDYLSENDYTNVQVNFIPKNGFSVFAEKIRP